MRNDLLKHFDVNAMFAAIDAEPTVKTRQFHAKKPSKKVPFTINHKAYRTAHRAKKNAQKAA